MNKFMSVVISLAMLLVAAGKVCAQTDSAQVAAKQYREDIEAVLNRMVEASTRPEAEAVRSRPHGWETSVRNGLTD